MSTKVEVVNIGTKFKSGVGQAQEFLTDLKEKTRPVFENPIFRKIGGGARIVGGLAAIYPWLSLHTLSIAGALERVGFQMPESFMKFLINASEPAIRLFIATMNIPDEIFPKQPTLEALTAIGLYSLLFFGGAWWGGKQIYDVLRNNKNKVISEEGKE